MILGWDDKGLGLVNFLITLGVLVAIFGVLLFVFIKVIKRRSGYLFLGISFVLLLLCLIFYLVPAMVVFAALFSSCYWEE